MDEARGLLKISHAVYGLACIPKHQLLVAGASEGTISILHLGTNSLVRQYSRTQNPIYHIDYHEATDSIWILHGGGYISVLGAEHLKEKAFFRISGDHLRCMAFWKGQVFIGSSDHHIYVLDPVSLEVTHRWKAHDNSVFALCIHPSGQYLFSGGRDAHLCVWDLKQDYKLISRIPAHNFTINDLKLSPDERYLVSASRDKTIKLWDAHTFELLKVIDHARNKSHTHSVNRLFWLKTDNSVISCSDDRKILRWEFLIS